MAANVPAIVATMAAMTETPIVVVTEEIIMLSWNSSAYQSKVKPDQTERLFDALNEKMIMRKIGA